MDRVLSLRDLHVWFPVRIGFIGALLGKEQKNVRAVDGIDLDVGRGEIFCLVGESGCGKTTTGKAILRLNDVTKGNILHNVPQEEMARLEAIEARLRELEAVVTPTKDNGGASAREIWSEIVATKRRILEIMYPWEVVDARLGKERLERSVRFLEEHAEGLRNGTDPTLQRVGAQERNRIELLKTRGPWFTPRRAKLMERLERDLKEARYKLLRAEVTRTRKGKFARKTRGLERRLGRMQRQVRKEDPNAVTRAQEMEKAFQAKLGRLAEMELKDVTDELKEAKGELDASLRAEQRSVERAAGELERLSRALEDLRAKGGPMVEYLELRGLQEEIVDRYDLTRWTKERTKELRKRMQIIYQDPYESLNPKMSIFDIVSEPLFANKIVDTSAEAGAVVRKALDDVGLKPAQEYMFRFPHELSGGQRQRVGIAAALVVDPDFIVADEPVSMLDASVRTEILALLLDLKKRRDLTYLFITHDLGLAWILADRIAVMYLGKIVETGDGPEVIQNPRHPYTKALISVVPSPNPEVKKEKIILRGERPNPVDIPTGCRFHPRCPMAVGICGWNSEEVRDELTKLFQEDGGSFPEAQRSGEVVAEDPFALRVVTPDPAALEKYLKKRIQTVALGRPALGAIRAMNANAGVLSLTLHTPVEPPLRQITPNVSVACHLVEPEAEASPAAGVAT